jgi:DNA-binding MarR family transcriptional regulator
MTLLKHENKAVSVELECAGLLMEVAPLVMRTIRCEMRRHRADLSVPQFRALAYLSRHEGASLSDVAERVGLTPPAMSRLIEGLVARDLVTRIPSAADRRRVVLALTPVGKAMLDEARQDTRARLADELATLPEAELVALAEALHALRPHLEAGRDPGDG